MASDNVEDVNISQFRDQSEALKQLWRVNYLGDGEYAIRSMQNPSLVMAMSSVGIIERNVMAYNLGTSNDNLPDRAQWYFRGTTYSMFTEATVESTTYRLAVAAGDTSDYSNIYAITTGGSGAASWRLVEIETALEGVVIYSGNTNATGRTYSMNIGDNKLFTAIFYTAGPDATQSFTWTTGNSAVATVDSSGRVYATGTGTTVITATSTVDVRRSAYFYVTVGADTDFDGISDAIDSNTTSNTFTGQIRSFGDNCDHASEYGAENYAGSLCDDSCQTYFNMEYTMDYSLFLESPQTYYPALAQSSSVATTIVYHNRNWYNGTSYMDICEWLEYHGMLGVDYYPILSTDDHKSEVVLGYRPVVNSSDKTIVIAVIIRGTNGTLAEWSSNVDIGNTDDFLQYPEWTNSAHHMGFDITSNRIIDQIEEYVELWLDSTSRYEDYDYTYWVTGHSRGGALANLVAAKLIDRGESVFAYTFAAPGTVVCSRCQSYGYDECEQSTGCTAHASKYSSIFNIINEDDFIPYFPLKQWYFTLYGRTTQDIKVSSGYTTLWKNAWKDSAGVALGTEYMHMESPTAPLALFSIAAASRNACYDYIMDGTGLAQLGAYPSNTEDYYITNGLACYQSPMFLMKYFAAVAANEVTGYDFLTLSVAPYLEPAKLSLLAQLIGISDDELADIISQGSMNITIGSIRLQHPHMPQSYNCLANIIVSSNFRPN